MEALGALGLFFVLFLSFITGAYLVDTHEFIDEASLRDGKEVTVSNGDKYTCKPTKLTERKLAIEKELAEIK